MKKIIAISLMLMSPLLSFANSHRQMVLDKVMFQISAKEWVSTQTALLSVNINAVLSNADLVKARVDIMGNLDKIAKGEWHLIQFNRSQDTSGLDKLYVEAQARIPQANLTDIYQNAKNVSKPGAKYSINAVEFKPSLDDIQRVKTNLRERLYKQVNDELERLNKIYPGQHYSVNRVLISEGDVIPVQPRMYTMAKESTFGAAPVAAAPALTVSNELTLTAIVEAASNRLRGDKGASTNN